MPFEAVTKGHYEPKMALVDVVSISRPKGSYSFNITISNDLMSKMGNTQFLQVKLGTGEHAGLALLHPVSADYGEGVYKVFRPSGGKKAACRLSIGPKAIGIHLKQLASTRLRHYIVPEGLIVDFHLFHDGTLDTSHTHEIPQHG